MATKDKIASWGYAELWDKFPVPARPSESRFRGYITKEEARKSFEKTGFSGKWIDKDICMNMPLLKLTKEGI